ncbi:hypothetical protein Tco_0500840 [Tanacetum coccineum]
MKTLQFADTHNLVAFLTKSAESEGFEQIVDFPNASSIRYALTLQALVDGKKTIITETTVRRDLQLEDANGVDCLPNATIFEQLTLMGKDTEAPQPSGPITNIADGAFTKENVTKHSNDPLLSGLKLKELMALCTNLQNIVLNLEHTKTTQALEIDNLKRRVKKLEKQQRSKTHGLKRLYMVGLSARVVSSKDEGLGKEDASKQGRKIDDIDADAEITLVDETQGKHDDLMFDTCVLNDEEVFARQDMAEKEVSTADPVTTADEVDTTANVKVSTAIPTAATITNVELNLAQTLAELKSARPKIKWVVMQEPSESTPTISLQLPSQVKGQGSKDKGIGIMVEEPFKIKKKDQISFDEQEAIRLQAKFDEEVRLAREKDEANVALIEEWNDIQAKIEADQLLAERLQAREQEELTTKEKAKLFQ